MQRGSVLEGVVDDTRRLGPSLVSPSSACSAAGDTLSYIPALAGADLGGRVTGSTFVLEQPRCIFDKYDSADIWLVVATEAVLPFTTIPIPHFPANTSAYLTLGAMQYHYRCPEPNGELTVLRVGSETSCANNTSVPNCNGPLPGPGPYWWVVRNNFFSEMSVIQWHARQTPSSPGTGGGRSGAMIAITAILSVLLAILLAALLAALCR
uniref:Uroplakin 3B n=1 Tax=Pavo cristatus TaxID=9049 RepID=A0A8C9L8Z0_PAVCR